MKKIAIIIIFISLISTSCHVSDQSANDLNKNTNINNENVVSGNDLDKDEESNIVKVIEKILNEDVDDYTVNIVYPEFVLVDNIKEEDINKTIRDLIDEEKIDFMETIDFNSQDSKVEEGGSFLEITYHINLLRPDIISIVFTVNRYIYMAAHPMNYKYVLNYDLINNEEFNLDDVFDYEDYLIFISQRCELELSEELEDSLFEDGLEPVNENFANFNLTNEELVLYFDPYQVAAYAVGPQVVTISLIDIYDKMDLNGPGAYLMTGPGEGLPILE